ncbi:MAG: hypothetical protein GY940_13710, partial [bacterium]|nr:hypothetical protein [bacterium]
YLCAYFTLKVAVHIDTAQVSRYLEEKLPSYMVPAHFMELTGLPLTPGGKVDKKSLPQPKIISAAEYRPPRNERERFLVDLWSRILRLDAEQIGIDDKFSRMGGHSLKAIQVVNALHREFDVEFNIQTLFQHPTIRELTNLVEKSRHTHYQRIEPQEKKEYYPLSYSQKRLWFINRQEPGSLAFNLADKITKTVNPGFVKKALEILTDRHESLRTCFKEVKKMPVQFIQPGSRLDFDIIDLTSLTETGREKKRLQ